VFLGNSLKLFPKKILKLKAEKDCAGKPTTGRSANDFCPDESYQLNTFEMNQSRSIRFLIWLDLCLATLTFVPGAIAGSTSPPAEVSSILESARFQALHSIKKYRLMSWRNVFPIELRQTPESLGTRPMTFGMRPCHLVALYGWQPMVPTGSLLGNMAVEPIRTDL
jgi:hypothetical protein